MRIRFTVPVSPGDLVKTYVVDDKYNAAMVYLGCSKHPGMKDCHFFYGPDGIFRGRAVDEFDYEDIIIIEVMSKLE